MGTSYTILFNTKDGKIFDKSLVKTAVDSLLIEINNKFSTYIDDSEISVFNNSQDSLVVSNEFIELFTKSLNMHNISKGSFDFTILDIVELWGFGKENKRFQIPKDSTIKVLLNTSCVDNLMLKNNTLYKFDKNLKIDFSAIAKGWAVDRIATMLENLNIMDYMVEIGGEISLSGTNSSDKLWTIGIAYPQNKSDGLMTKINLSNISIATSGTYNNSFWYKGNRYSHLIDPQNGYPIKHDIISATILTHQCANADAIATAVMVKGFDAGLEWINSMPDVECMLIKKDEGGEYIYGKSAGFTY